jgi:hypothetical protein
MSGGGGGGGQSGYKDALEVGKTPIHKSEFGCQHSSDSSFVILCYGKMTRKFFSLPRFLIFGTRGGKTVASRWHPPV